MKRLEEKDGHLVITGSMSADVAEERASGSIATEAPISGFASSLRKEANPLGIKISLLEPGTISSDRVDESSETSYFLNHPVVTSLSTRRVPTSS